jgi:hypothetical protein
VPGLPAYWRAAMAYDAKGKQRKLEVSSRRGYYMPKNDTDQAAANK